MGCDVFGHLRGGHTDGFNPRTRVGCDCSPVNPFICGKKFQSTHPRGVRLASSAHPPMNSLFQSTHPRGVRRCHGLRQCDGGGFQSTHPRGVRLEHIEKPVNAHAFQSTHPRGVRLRFFCTLSSGKKFQSTHPRGVRRRNGPDSPAVHTVSIHAPAWGATPVFPCHRLYRRCFNPRTRVGCDFSSRLCPPTIPCFNPRTRVGCD